MTKTNTQNFSISPETLSNLLKTIFQYQESNLLIDFGEFEVEEEDKDIKELDMGLYLAVLQALGLPEDDWHFDLEIGEESGTCCHDFYCHSVSLYNDGELSMDRLVEICIETAIETHTIK